MGHLQQFNMFIAMAWLPFACWQFFEMLQNLKWKNVIGFSVFFFLLAGTGHSSLAVIIFYVLVAVGLLKLFEIIKQKDKQLALEFLLKLFSSAVLIIALMSPSLVAAAQSASYVARLSGVANGQAVLAPFPPQGLLSLFLPVSTATHLEFYATELSCSSLFFGFFPLCFLIFSFFRRKTKLEWVLLVFLLVYLLASFGEYTPVRLWLHKFVPLFSLFRGAGQIRIVVLLLALALISIYFKKGVHEKGLRFIFPLASLLFLAASVFSFLKIYRSEFPSFAENMGIADFVYSLRGWKLIFCQAVLFFVVSFLGWMFSIRKSVVSRLKVIAIASVIFLVAAVQFNIYFNLAAKDSPRPFQAWIKNLPAGFTLPPETAVNEYALFANNARGVYRNSGNFLKKPMNNEYSSFKFNAFERLSDSLPEILKYLYSRPVAYLSDSVVAASGYKGFLSEKARKGNFSFFDHDAIPEGKLDKISNTDSVTCLKFYPGEMIFLVQCRGRKIFNLQQSWYDGWEIFDNGKKVEAIKKNAGLCMSIVLENGTHEISFKYRNGVFLAFYSFSLSLFFILLFIFLYGGKLFWKLFFTLFYAAFISFTVVHFFTARGKENRNKSEFERLADETVKTNGACIYSSGSFYPHEINKYSAKGFVLREDDVTRLRAALKFVRESGGREFYYAWYNQQPSQQIVQYIRNFFPVVLKRQEYKNYGVISFSDKGDDYGFEKFYSMQDTLIKDAWYKGRCSIDSSVFLKDKFSYRVTPAWPYGPAFVRDGLDVSGNNSQAFLYRCMIKTSPAPIFLVVDLVRNDTSFTSRFFPLAQYVNSADEWSPVLVRVESFGPFRQGDKVRMYIMHGSEKDIWLSEIRVERLRE
jgi:hypothetical protein